MSVDNFKPEIHAATVEREMEKALIFGSDAIINRDYEGEIAQVGNTVSINSIGSVTVGDYDGTDIGDPEELTGAETKLVITEQKYFNFQVDDVDKRQATGQLMTTGMAQAAYDVADTIDQYIASLYTDMTLVTGTEGTPKSLATATDAYDDVILPMKTALSDAKCPSQGRWMILPPWFIAKLQQDDRFVAYSAADQMALRMNGVVGRCAGFQIFESTNVPETSRHTGSKVMAGIKEAWTFAAQTPPKEMEAYRPQKLFADAVKGLTLYGAKVVRSDKLVYSICSET